MRGSLFGEEHSSVISKEDLTNIKESFSLSIDEMYEKHKNRFPMPYAQLAKLPQSERIELAHAAIKFFRDNSAKVLKNKEHVDTKDLTNFLNTPIEKAYKNDEYLKSTKGLGFLNSFIKEYLLSVEVHGKGANVYERMKDDKWMYKVICKTLSFSLDLAVQKIYSTMKLVDTQSISNIRPPSMAAIYHEFGIERTKGKKTLNILTSSEGWLGRLLASYYIAHHNPDRVVNYHTIDPNPNVAEAFQIVKEFLLSYGGVNKASNWKPVFHQCGSEEDLDIPEGMEFDIIGTSPPYGFQEVYTAGREVTVKFEDGTRKDMSIAENKFLVIDGIEKMVKDIHTGDTIVLPEGVVKVVKTRKSK